MSNSLLTDSEWESEPNRIEPPVQASTWLGKACVWGNW